MGYYCTTAVLEINQCGFDFSMVMLRRDLDMERISHLLNVGLLSQNLLGLEEKTQTETLLI